MFRSSLLSLAVVALPLPLVAQAPYTADAARSDLSVLAADSMAGRLAGTPGARSAANYLARRLQGMGLAPAGDSGTYLQRVPLERRQMSPSSTLVLAGNGHTVTLRFGPTFVTPWGRPDSVATYQAVWGDLYTGPGVDSTFRAAEGKFVVIVIPEGEGLLVQGIPATHRPAGIIALFASPRYRVRALRSMQPSPLRSVGAVDEGDPPLVIYADRDSVAAALGALTQGAAGTAAPFTVTPHLSETVTPVTAWNVLALRPGTDPHLANEQILYLSDLDHIGRAGDPGANCRPIGADSICNGAGAVSGAVAELGVAQQMSVTPVRRSVLFAWLSADAPNLLGSRQFLDHRPTGGGNIVAAIDLGPVGRDAPDSLAEGGIRELAPALVHLADSVNAAGAHPFALQDRFATLTDPRRGYCRGRPAALASTGVPTLAFAWQRYPQYWRADDDATQMDAGKIARVGQLGYAIGAALAGDRARPAVDTLVARSLCR